MALDIYRFSCINKTIKKVVPTELQGEEHQTQYKILNNKTDTKLQEW